MESSPPSPMPFEYGGGDKDKKEEKGDKKKSSPLRIPLPASEVHASEPKKNERLFPLFEKKDDVPEAADAKDAKKEAVEPVAHPEQPAAGQHEDETPHKDLEEIHDTLWTEFEATEPAAHEPSATERANDSNVVEAPLTPAQHSELAMPSPEPAAHTESFEDIMQRADSNGELRRMHEAVAEQQEPQHEGWDESHTIHLNESSTTDVPSAAGMAAEVAATEPDQESVSMWEELDAAPAAAEVPEWHPESQPLSTNEQFEDIMQRADMGEQFVAATSEEPVAETVPPTTPHRTLGSFNSGAALGGETTPDVPPSSPFPVTERTDTPHVTGNESPAWHSTYSRHGSGSMLRHAAEAGLVGGALAGASAANAAETGGALAGGAAAGAIAGGVAGHMVGERAARQEAQREVQQEMRQRDEHINVLTNEQRVTHEQLERLTQANQQLNAEQKVAAEKATVAAAAVPVTERLHDTQDTKVVRSEWVDMVVDKRTGKLVESEGVNEFGNEFRAEQRAEAEPPDPLAIALAAAQAAAQTSADVTDTYQREHGQPMSHGYGHNILPSGQLPSSHELGAGQGHADPNHRLPEPRNPLAAAASNPLLWVAVTVLVLAFLAAAFM